MPKKLTIEFVKEQFESRGYILLNTEYKSCNSKLDYICPKGHKNKITWDKFKKGQGCSDCAGLKKLTIEYVREQFEKEGYTLLNTEYKNSRTKLNYICPRGHKNNIVWNDFQQGYRCPDCGGSKKLTIEYVREQFEKEGYTLLSTEYINSNSKLDYICPKGHKNKIIWGDFQHGYRCPDCAGHKKLTIEFIREQFKKEGYTLLSTEYINSITELDYICPKGHYNDITWGNFQQGQRCPVCAESGFNPNKSAILYYIKLNNGLYKIGITNKTVKKRFCKDDFEMFNSINTIHYEKGKDAYNEEQRILKENKKFQYNGPDVLKNGNTELFTKDILENQKQNCGV